VAYNVILNSLIFEKMFIPLFIAILLGLATPSNTNNNCAPQTGTTVSTNGTDPGDPGDPGDTDPTDPGDDGTGGDTGNNPPR